MTTWLKAFALLVALAALSPAERPGGEVRRRLDAKNQEYFEIFADARNGNHAAPAPMRIGTGNPAWPKSVTIRAGSTWRMSSGAEGMLDGGGNPARACAPCPAPSLPWGALLARWVKLDTTQILSLLTRSMPTEPISEWFLVGKQLSIAVPINLVDPRPHRPSWLAALPGLVDDPQWHYTPLLALQYRCNDSDLQDNDGWLHVYQAWGWE